MSYQRTSHYVWYLNTAGGQTRRRRLPEFETDHKNRVLVRVGERYCRVLIGEGELCINDTIFASRSNLVKHIQKAHDLEVFRSATGALSGADNINAGKYYKRLHDIAQGKEVNLDTPQKDTATRRTSTKMYAPRDADGNHDLARMKEESGYAPAVRCSGCKHHDRDCPPPERDEMCRVWSSYRNPDSGSSAARAAARKAREAIGNSHKVGGPRAPTPEVDVLDSDTVRVDYEAVAAKEASANRLKSLLEDDKSVSGSEGSNS